MRTAGAAGLGAGAERFVDDGLDGARAPAAFGAAAEAAIDLLGIARQIVRRVDGAANIVVADDVTGTNNHEDGEPIGDAKQSTGAKPSTSLRYLRLRQDAKGKTRFSSDSKLVAGAG